MAFKDNRQFLKALEKSGDAIRIKQEVDWDLEAGAICRRAWELGAPAPFFEKVKDYPAGFRLFGSPVVGQRRIAVAMGLSPDAPRQVLQTEYERRIQHPIKPVIVSTGPCQDNILTGDNVDLFRFPVPMIHEGNGGRYIGTWHLIIIRDPDSDWVNWGMYRVMVHNRNNVGIMLTMSNQGGRIFFMKYAARKKPMPIAIAIGADPVSSLVAAYIIKEGSNEVDYSGALSEQPVELVKCRTSDLLVPAHSEIVLEGEVWPGAAMPEGPFGEFTAYRTSCESRDVCRINAITYRNDPILTMVSVGGPGKGGEGSPTALFYETELKKLLKEHGVPVTDVYIPPEATNFIVIVGVRRTTHSNMAVKVKHVVKSYRDTFDKIIVVDDDIDVFNLSDVVHALATRCHPERGVSIDKRDNPSSLTPYLTSEERRWGQGASILFDCTWPAQWAAHNIPQKISFNEAYPDGVKEKVLNDWEKYGFPNNKF